MNYLIHIIIIIQIYILLTLSFNLLLGYSNLFSLAHAAFYGLGAYTASLLMLNLNFNYFFTIPIIIIAASLFSIIVASPSIKLKGDYFMLSTMAFQILIFNIFNNWIELTRGPYGISGIPSPSILGYQLSGPYIYCLFISIVTLISITIFYRLHKSLFGLFLKSIRDDEMLSISLAKPTYKLKIISFVIAGIFASIAGSLYATYISYIDPTIFSLEESVFIMTAVVVGGSGNLKGPLIGTLFIITIPEILRFIGFPDSIAANLRQIIYAITLILVMRYRPQGLVGEYKLE
ncbi:MAG: branched-chain amino acid ABC transporter permease [Elusimicrobiales bacterium]|nr:branched-chain amino acid ABC transporter permease [Elusimicrobiales bacterium]